SRRRHTRSKRDWSSDVCSSDLPCFFHLYRVLPLLSMHSLHVLQAFPCKFPFFVLLSSPGVTSSGSTDFCAPFVLFYHHSPFPAKIGRASCRERVETSVVNALSD